MRAAAATGGCADGSGARWRLHEGVTMRDLLAQDFVVTDRHRETVAIVVGREWDALRPDSRFKALLRKMDLPQR